MDNKSLKTRRTTKPKDNNRKRKVKSNTLDISESNAKISRQSKPLMNRLSVDFFRNKSCVELSKALLGQILCRQVSPKEPVLKAMIVETEAYLGAEDKGSATYKGRRTERLEPLYMSCGTCFVYFTYGMYYCMNISAEAEGEGVLLRAVQPLEAIDCMQRLRAKSRKTETQKEFKLKDLANGPSKLCMALDINKDNINKVDITDSDLIWIEGANPIPQTDIVSAKRVGIPKAEEWSHNLLRFYIKDNECVSQK